MGGYGTWELAAEYPESFAAIVPICGAGSTEDVDRLKTLPAWVFHGQRDPAVPSRYSIEMVDALKKAGANVTFTLYPDLGHDCWTATYANDALYAWLMKQHRAP
jgi:predicted peptidase